MKDNKPLVHDFRLPVSGILSGRHRDIILASVANRLVQDFSLAARGEAAVLEFLGFEKLSAEQQLCPDMLAHFYRTPQRLLDDLFHTALTHLELRIAKAVSGQNQCNSFKAAYEAVSASSQNLGAVTLSGVDSLLANRLYQFFAEMMAHDVASGEFSRLQAQWNDWYACQQTRYA